MNRFPTGMTLIAALMQSTLLLADIALVTDGRPEAIIVIGKDAPWIDRHAAEELSNYIRAISGASLPVVDVTAPVVKHATNLVLIGHSATNHLIDKLALAGKIELSREQPGGDGFRVTIFEYRSRNYCVLGGSRGRATLYAVYDFLENECGVGYFADGDFIPSGKTLSWAPMNRTEKPYFQHRMAPNACSYVYSSQYWDTERWKKEHDYMVKRKMNFSYFTLGWEVVMHRVWKRFGINTGEPSKGELWAAELQKEVRGYAEKLDMDVVGQLWGGHVSTEFARKHPELKYVVTEWAGVNTSYHVHPSDPMFQKIVQACMEEWQKAYGPTHIWDQAPYPETSPGATQEDKHQLKIDWAHNMSTAIGRSDPNGILYMSGWFLQGEDWTPEVCRDFFDAMVNDRYLVSDAWAETRPVYSKTGYFGGKSEWMFGVLNTFGNVERLHGDVSDLIHRVQQIPIDPQAEHCTGFYIDPESTQHNFLYFDLAAELSWNPIPVNLDTFLHQYSARRYGVTAGSAMTEVWKKVCQTVYSDNIEANPRPVYHNPLPRDGGGGDLFASADKLSLRLSYLPVLKQALILALKQRSQLQHLPHYQRDVLDIGRTFLGILFDYHAYQAHQAFSQDKNQNKVDQQGDRMLSLLDDIGLLVATRPEFYLEEEMKRGRQLPVIKVPESRTSESIQHTTSSDSPGHENDRDVRLRYTALAGMARYPGLLDYAAADRVELIRYYYRPRVQAWLDHMKEHIDTGQIDYGQLLSGAYKDITQAFVDAEYTTPQTIPSGQKPSDLLPELLMRISLPDTQQQLLPQTPSSAIKP